MSAIDGEENPINEEHKDVVHVEIRMGEFGNVYASHPDTDTGYLMGSTRTRNIGQEVEAVVTLLMNEVEKKREEARKSVREDRIRDETEVFGFRCGLNVIYKAVHRNTGLSVLVDADGRGDAELMWSAREQVFALAEEVEKKHRKTASTPPVLDLGFEPPVGSTVMDSCSKYWVRTSSPLAAWHLVQGASSGESWSSLTSEYGPLSSISMQS